MNYIWIPMLILSSALGAFCARLSNLNVPYGGLYVFCSCMLGTLVWVWVSRISKNLLLDNILYDIIMSLSYTGTFILLKYGESFTPLNWVGIALAVIGLVLMKI